MLNQRGLHSGKGEPFSAFIVARLRKVYGLKDRYSRLRAQGLLTVQEIATRLGVTTTTVKIWRRAGLLVGHAFTDKPECLYEMPTDDVIPTKQQGRKLSTRAGVAKVVPNHTMEVQHAT